MDIGKTSVTLERLRIIAVAGVLLLGSAGNCIAADDVGVYVGNPGAQRYIDAARSLRQQLPAARARWNEVDATGASFTIASYSDDPRVQSVRPCVGIPISVQVRQGRLISAVYARSTARCKAGTPVKAADDPILYSLLSPPALFQEVASQVERGIQGQTCIEASFDDDFGLPTALRIGCPGVEGPDLRIQISDIVSVRQTLWNRAITFASVGLCILALALYQYQRVRRRQEAMPGLLLR